MVGDRLATAKSSIASPAFFHVAVDPQMNAIADSAKVVGNKLVESVVAMHVAAIALIQSAVQQTKLALSNATDTFSSLLSIASAAGLAIDGLAAFLTIATVVGTFLQLLRSRSDEQQTTKTAADWLLAV